MSFGQFFLKNLALPVALIAFGTGAGVIMQSREIDANQYRILRNAMKAGSAGMRIEIAEAMRDGRVNHWEYTDLLKRYWTENNALVVNMAANSVAEERLVLAAMARQVKSP